jgi:hypothetical protein
MEHAGVAELADAPDSKSGARKGVEVQVLSPVLEFTGFSESAAFAGWQESPKESLRGTAHPVSIKRAGSWKNEWT